MDAQRKGNELRSTYTVDKCSCFLNIRRDFHLKDLLQLCPEVAARLRGRADDSRAGPLEERRVRQQAATGERGANRVPPKDVLVREQ